MSEFERQVDNLVERGYPDLAGLGEEELRGRLAPLEERARDGGFAIVVGGVAPVDAIGVVELRGKPGYTSMEADDLARFGPIEDVDVPAGLAYLVTDFDTGPETLNVTPDDALPWIIDAGRSPLTIDEGIALVTQFPELLRERKCFSLLGSRCGDRRVTALWVKRGGRPRLGWCYAGARHTWLGSASCGARIGV